MNWNWQQKALVEAEFPTGAQLRLTLGAVSSYDVGTYNALLHEAREFIKEQHGITAQEYLQKDDPARRLEWGDYHGRAVMLACLLSVEAREDADKEWETTELPAEWRDIRTFRKAIPPDLLNRWFVAAIDLNPGQFLDLPGDDEKKGVRVSSSRLLN